MTSHVIRLFASILLLAASLHGQSLFFQPSFAYGIVPTANLAVWYSADCITYSSGSCSAPSDGSNVGTWDDRSGNANNATSSGTCTFHTNQINGEPALNFSAANCKFLMASNITNTETYTLFLVIKASSSDCSGSSYLVSGTLFGAFAFRVGAASAESEIASTSNSDDANGNHACDSSSWHQVNIWTQDANISGGFTGRFRIDRADDGWNVITPGSTWTNQTNGFGMNVAQNNHQYSGMLSELILYTSILSSTQISTVETYLNNKYGL